VSTKKEKLTGAPQKSSIETPHTVAWRFYGVAVFSGAGVFCRHEYQQYRYILRQISET
jgi:hypothetical protein